ncbi:MAG TPA: di-heme oxidoredictase family protein, partial [Archangium sp.]
RFGWKANQPSLRQQNAGAFRGDIGITSDLFPEEDCPPAQAACRAAPSGGAPELDAQKLEHVTFYTRMLAVPARRNVDDSEVLRGRRLFRELDCAACHVPRLETGIVEDAPELSKQVIFPYTDLLLHDMGAELADDRPDFEATGREWRTPPLWGIGLVETVNRHTRFLHDGRARSLEEAILWHGGEAERSREHFRELSAPDRAALLRFLESL